MVWRLIYSGPLAVFRSTVSQGRYQPFQTDLHCQITYWNSMRCANCYICMRKYSSRSTLASRRFCTSIPSTAFKYTLTELRIHVSSSTSNSCFNLCRAYISISFRIALITQLGSASHSINPRYFERSTQIFETVTVPAQSFTDRYPSL